MEFVKNFQFLSEMQFANVQRRGSRPNRSSTTSTKFKTLNKTQLERNLEDLKKRLMTKDEEVSYLKQQLQEVRRNSAPKRLSKGSSKACSGCDQCRANSEVEDIYGIVEQLDRVRLQLNLNAIQIKESKEKTKQLKEPDDLELFKRKWLGGGDMPERRRFVDTPRPVERDRKWKEELQRAISTRFQDRFRDPGFRSDEEEEMPLRSLKHLLIRCDLLKDTIKESRKSLEAILSEINGYEEQCNFEQPDFDLPDFNPFLGHGNSRKQTPFRARLEDENSFLF